jgi:hypothetical protein
MHHSLPCTLNCLAASISLLQLTTARKRPLLSPINFRRGLTENTCRGIYPLLCDVTAYAEVCLPSNSLETGCITPLFHCWCVYGTSVYLRDWETQNPLRSESHPKAPELESEVRCVGFKCGTSEISISCVAAELCSSVFKLWMSVVVMLDATFANTLFRHSNKHTHAPDVINVYWMNSVMQHEFRFFNRTVCNWRNVRSLRNWKLWYKRSKLF